MQDLDKVGNPFSPSPPILSLLQQTNHDLIVARDKIDELLTSLMAKEKKCTDLENINAALLNKIEDLDKKEAVALKEKDEVIQKINQKDGEVLKLNEKNKDLETQFKQLKKDHLARVEEVENQVKSMKKVNKLKDKEIYDYEKKLSNYMDTISYSKAELKEVKDQKLALEKKCRKFEKKIGALESKAKRESVSSQTPSSIDTPYLITDELPPISSSHLCRKSKPVSMYNSLPNLTFLIWMDKTEDMLASEAAEEALNMQYDMEVEAFYNEARITAAALREVYEKNAIGRLFDPKAG